MGFKNLGSPSIESFDPSAVAGHMAYYFPEWLTSMNYDAYTENFILESRGVDFRERNLKDFDDNIAVSTHSVAVNDFIRYEARTLKRIIRWIEDAFHHLNIENFRLSGVKSRIELDDINYNEGKLQRFISDHKNNPLRIQRTGHELGEIFRYIDEESQQNTKIYFLIVMYKDFKRIEEFLEAKFDKEAASNPSEDSPEGFDTKNILIKEIYFEHTDVFVGNAYTLWKRCFEQFQFKHDDRKPIGWLFAKMKNEGHINNISKAYMTRWLNKNTFMIIDKELQVIDTVAHTHSKYVLMYGELYKQYRDQYNLENKRRV